MDVGTRRKEDTEDKMCEECEQIDKVHVVWGRDDREMRKIQRGRKKVNKISVGRGEV